MAKAGSQFVPACAGSGSSTAGVTGSDCPESWLGGVSVGVESAGNGWPLKVGLVEGVIGRGVSLAGRAVSLGGWVGSGVADSLAITATSVSNGGKGVARRVRVGTEVSSGAVVWDGERLVCVGAAVVGRRVGLGPAVGTV